MIVARELLKRYPALRETWPVQRARAWREQQGYRRNPRRMAAWYREAPDLHTRVAISNLELPEASEVCQPVGVVISLYDEAGARLVGRRYVVGRNASLLVEVADLLPAEHRGVPTSGQVRMDLERPIHVSSRAYLHWYNDRSLTSSHEKYGVVVPGVGGYWTVPNVQHDATYRTHLAVVNLDEQPYRSSVVLKDADGRPIEASVTLPPNGSRFVALDDLFTDPGGFLGARPGILYFGNTHQPAMYYYFIYNPTLGTWRAQHL